MGFACTFGDPLVQEQAVEEEAATTDPGERYSTPTQEVLASDRETVPETLPNDTQMDNQGPNSQTKCKVKDEASENSSQPSVELLSQGPSRTYVLLFATEKFIAMEDIKHLLRRYMERLGWPDTELGL